MPADVGRVYKITRRVGTHVRSSSTTFVSHPTHSAMTDTFDPNFCFPVKDLENAWVKLAPFNVRLTDQSRCVTVY